MSGIRWLGIGTVISFLYPVSAFALSCVENLSRVSSVYAKVSSIIVSVAGIGVYYWLLKHRKQTKNKIRNEVLTLALLSGLVNLSSWSFGNAIFSWYESRVSILLDQDLWVWPVLVGIYLVVNWKIFREMGKELKGNLKKRIMVASFVFPVVVNLFWPWIAQTVSYWWDNVINVGAQVVQPEYWDDYECSGISPTLWIRELAVGVVALGAALLVERRFRREFK